MISYYRNPNRQALQLATPIMFSSTTAYLSTSAPLAIPNTQEEISFVVFHHTMPVEQTIRRVQWLRQELGERSQIDNYRSVLNINLKYVE